MAKAVPLPSVPSAFAAKTLQLPCVSTAFAAKTRCRCLAVLRSLSQAEVVEEMLAALVEQVRRPAPRQQQLAATRRRSSHRLTPGSVLPIVSALEDSEHTK